MSTDPHNPEEPALPSDALAHLERMRERAKENQAAWRKLLEELDALKKKNTPDTPTNTPTPTP